MRVRLASAHAHTLTRSHAHTLTRSHAHTLARSQPFARSQLFTRLHTFTGFTLSHVRSTLLSLRMCSCYFRRSFVETFLSQNSHEKLTNSYKISLWEKIPPRGTGPTVGPNVTKCHSGKKSHRWWDWSHRGTKCYKMSLWEKNTVVHAGPPYRYRRRLAPRPATTATSIYISEFAETAEISDIRLVPPISATTL